MEYVHDRNCRCPSCMKWDSFDNIYIDFAMEYSQQMLTYCLSRELLSNFPKNMPPNILGPIMAKRLEVLNNEMKRRGQKQESYSKIDEEFIKDIASIDLTPEQHRIRCAFEGVYGLARFGKKIHEFEFPQFERILIHQNIIVICSFAEGFFANVIRYLCEVNQNPLTEWDNQKGKKNNGMTPSQKIDQFAFEMGQGNILKKINRIQKNFNVQFSLSKSVSEKISELFLIRNCIVHNAGLISQVYKDNSTINTDIIVGDEIELQDEIIEDLLDTLVDVIITVYRKISTIILKKTEDKLMYGAYRNIKL